MLTTKQLKSLIKTLRANGVVSYECDGIKLLLDPNFQVQAKTPKSVAQHIPGQMIADLNKASPGFHGVSDEDVLLWSAPKFDEAS